MMLFSSSSLSELPASWRSTISMSSSEMAPSPAEGGCGQGGLGWVHARAAGGAMAQRRPAAAVRVRAAQMQRESTPQTCASPAPAAAGAPSTSYTANMQRSLSSRLAAREKGASSPTNSRKLIDSNR